MSVKTKALLITFLSIGIMALLAYGYISSQKLDAKKEKVVESNIKDYLYDEASDTLNIEDYEEEEDLDGNEVVDEDDDFEVYEEPEPEIETVLDNVPSEAPKVNPKPVPPSGTYYVIVGTFKSKSNAERKVGQLDKAKTNGFVTQIGTSKLYTAAAGQFETKQEANNLLKLLVREYDIKGVVKKVN